MTDLFDHGMTCRGPSEKYHSFAFRKWYWQGSDVGVMAEITVNATSPAEHLLLDGGRDAAGDLIQLWAVAANVPSASRTESAIRNAASVVVVCRDMTNNENLFVIGADATCETEDFMLAGGRAGRINNVHVMRVAHHGSATSSRSTFVDAANPSLASVVSSSRDNDNYCLPKQSVVMRWVNKMPTTLSANKTIGYWADGTGAECSGAVGPEEPTGGWSGRLVSPTPTPPARP